MYATSSPPLTLWASEYDLRLLGSSLVYFTFVPHKTLLYNPAGVRTVSSDCTRLT